MALLEPQPITIKTLRGEEKTYILSKFPAVAGREIVAGYPLTAVPKMADYKSNEEVMLKCMCYVGVELSGNNVIPLTTRVLVDNHVPDWETLGKLEIAMMKYNTSFFENGGGLTFLKGIIANMTKSVSPMLMPLLEELSAAVKRRSKS